MWPPAGQPGGATCAHSEAARAPPSGPYSPLCVGPSRSRACSERHMGPRLAVPRHHIWLSESDVSGTVALTSPLTATSSPSCLSQLSQRVPAVVQAALAGRSSFRQCHSTYHRPNSRFPGIPEPRGARPSPHSPYNIMSPLTPWLVGLQGGWALEGLRKFFLQLL